MDEIAQALASAFQFHQAGNLSEAERRYREVLARQPANSDALYLLGVAALQQGRPADAVGLISRALEIVPNHAACLTQLGKAYAALQQWDRAAESLRRAAAIDPNSAAIHFNLGLVEGNRGQFDRAAASFERAVALDPTRVEAHYNLGNVWKDLGRFDAAERCYREAIRRQPGFVMAFNNLAHVLRAQGRLDEAQACLSQALAIAPGFAEAHSNLGTMLQTSGRFDEALACYEQAVRLEPQMAQGHYNLGNALRNLGRFEDAERSYREAIRLQPGMTDAHNNLGTTLQATGRADEALASFDEAIRLQPDYAEAHYNRSLVLLRRGDFAQGWAGHEWRLKCQDYRGVKLREPLWDGATLSGRTLLIHAEQGIGDTLQFIRYIPLARQRAGDVLALVPEVLMPLLAASGYENLIPGGTELPKFDLHAPLMSLPGILGTTLETVPNHVPYLAADPQLVEHWRQRLAAIEGFKIGIAWQGNPKYMYDRSRSIPLAAFEPLAKLPGVRLVSLQKGLGTEQIAAAAEQVPLIELGSQLDVEAGAFMDTAAVMKNIDLVIAPDTAAAHLAGGLGVPTWLALSCHPEARWMTERDDSPWYPTMRLFRQQEVGNWAGVFERMVAAVPPH